MFLPISVREHCQNFKFAEGQAEKWRPYRRNSSPDTWARSVAQFGRFLCCYGTACLSDRAVRTGPQVFSCFSYLCRRLCRNKMPKVLKRIFCGNFLLSDPTFFSVNCRSLPPTGALQVSRTIQNFQSREHFLVFRIVLEKDLNSSGLL